MAISGLGSIFSGVASAFSTIGAYNQAKSEARAFADTGYRKAKDRALDVKNLIAAQKNAFVRAGVEFEGTPQDIMQNTYNQGIEDIQDLESSYNKQLKNAKKQARAQLLGGLLGSGASVYAGGYNLKWWG